MVSGTFYRLEYTKVPKTQLHSGFEHCLDFRWDMKDVDLMTFTPKFPPTFDEDYVRFHLMLWENFGDAGPLWGRGQWKYGYSFKHKDDAMIMKLGFQSSGFHG